MWSKNHKIPSSWDFVSLVDFEPGFWNQFARECVYLKEILSG
jgi:hypothetical protein